MFVLLLLFASSQTHVRGYNNNQFDLTDLTLPSKPHGSEPTEAISNECSSMKKYFYRGQCWNLLTRGPCDEGQWLVLKRPDSEDHEPRVTCARRKCSDRDVYWPHDGFCYDAETARRRLCPHHQNAEAITDDFGEGRCRCRPADDDDDKAALPYVKVAPAGNGDENSQPCYPLYARGPCQEGHVLAPAGSGYGICARDMCAVKHHRVEPSRPVHLQLGLRRQRRQLRPDFQRQKLERRQPVNVQWTDGSCYEVGSQGPCSDNEQFVVFQDTMRPGCTSSVSIELNLTKGGCLKNHTGACQDRIEFQTSGSTAQSLEQGIIDRFYNKRKKT